MPTSETGHAKNVANFKDLIEFVTAYGAVYNPSKAALQLVNLQTRLAAEQTNLAGVVGGITLFNNAVNERANAFSKLKPLSTRLVNALSATDASKKTIQDAKGFNRKLQGKKATAAAKPIDPAAPLPPKSISSSQQSYDQQIQHMSGLVSVLASEATYLPNENDLKVATLTPMVASLTAKNNDVATQYAAISNARTKRDKGLYTEKTGLVPIALDVKTYIKSVFGASSPEFKQVNKINFKTITT